jgi:hypothetical protein
MSKKNSEGKQGLELLDDDALVRIVEADLEANSELKTHEAVVAFEILESRTPGLK